MQLHRCRATVAATKPALRSAASRPSLRCTARGFGNSAPSGGSAGSATPAAVRKASRAAQLSAARVGHTAMPVWETMWADDISKGDAFDAGRAEPALVMLMQRVALPAGRALVPGCGRGYAVAALASADRTALGLDIAPTGVAAARVLLAEELGCGTALAGQATVEVADFFTATPASLGGAIFHLCPFSLIFHWFFH